jgi:hypothetical protein
MFSATGDPFREWVFTAATIRSTCATRWRTGGAVEIMTGAGPARAELDAGDPAERDAVRFLLVLTHGAGGSPSSPDLLAVRDAALGLGGLVARVTQPYRIRGARAPGSADRQDAAWVEIVAALTGLVPGRAEQRSAGGVPHGGRRRGPGRDRAGVSAPAAGPGGTEPAG